MTGPPGAREEERDTILVATDGLKSSADALDFAVELAAEHQAHLVIVHVVPTLPLLGGDDEDESAEWYLLEHRQLGHTVLDDAAAEAEAHGVTATTSLVPGPTVDAILDAAETHDAALTVLGSRGRGPLASALLGSVSQKVLRRSNRPVLIVRNPWSPVLTANRPWLLHGRDLRDVGHPQS